MDLKIQDVAKLINASESAIKRLTEEGKMPCYRLNSELRFSRTEIESWVLRNPLYDEEKATREPFHPSGLNQYSLFRALHKGNVLFDVEGETKQDIIRHSVNKIALGLELDPNVLVDLLLDRESLMPTALGQGIAVPHTRDFLLNCAYDVVTVVFPKEPIEFGALDKQPVHSLFFLFACRDTHHLNILAKIAHFCSKEDNICFLQRYPKKEELLKYIKDWETSIS